MWSLEEHDRSPNLLDATEPHFAVLRPNWRKTKEGKRVGRQTRRGQRGQNGARARNRLDSKTRLDRCLYEQSARIGNGWRSRVGHQRDVVASLQPRDER